MLITDRGDGVFYTLLWYTYYGQFFNIHSSIQVSMLIKDEKGGWGAYTLYSIFSDKDTVIQFPVEE